VSGLTLSPAERDLIRIVMAVRQLMEGRSNATGTVTLTANVGSTTVPAPNCAAGSVVLLSPRTANAAAALATTFVTAGNGSFMVTHATNTQPDRTFGWAALG
jgi:hypothetical protein